MPNPFDKFDAPSSPPSPSASAGNAFDRFDTPATPAAEPIKFKSTADLAAFRSVYKADPKIAKLTDPEFLDWYGKSRTVPTTAVISGEDIVPDNSAAERKVIAKDYSPSQLMLSKLTFGLSDKAQAGVMKLADLATGSSRTFDDEQQQVDAAKAAFKAEHPGFDWTTSPLNLIGLVTGGPEALAAKVGGGVMTKAAATGAGYGALAGFGNARGSVADQAKEVGLSTLAGSIIGPVAAKVLPPIATAAGKGVGMVRNAFGREAVPDAASPAAGKILLNTLADQGMTPRQAGAKIDAARENGVPLALMDTGDEARGLAASLARKPGKSRTILRDAVIPRQEGQTERVQDAIARDLGTTADVRTASEEIMKGASESADPLYKTAYAAPMPNSATLQELSNRPSIQEALKRAYRIAKEEGRDPRELGFSLEKNGDVVLNPAQAELHSGVAHAQSELDTAAAELSRLQREARRGNGGTGVPKAQQAVESATEKLADAKSALAAKPAAGTAQTAPTNSTQTWDYIKRGLDDVVEEYRDKTTGRLVLDEAGRAVNATRHALRKELGELNPAYDAALKAYAGPASMSAALRKGAQVTNKNASTISAETRDLTAPELEQYRLGARSALSEMLEGRTDAADKVRALVGTPKKRLALAKLFGGEKSFDRFLTTLAQEAEANATHARANLGSPTALNLADDANLGGLTGVAVNAGARSLSGHGWTSNVLHTLADLARYGSGKSGEKLRAELAAGISETDPVVLAKALAAARRQAAIQRVGARRIAPRIGAAAGTLSALAASSQRK